MFNKINIATKIRSIPETILSLIMALSDEISSLTFIRNKIRSKLPINGTENVITEITIKSKILIFKKLNRSDLVNPDPIIDWEKSSSKNSQINIIILEFINRFAWQYYCYKLFKYIICRIIIIYRCNFFFRNFFPVI